MENTETAIMRRPPTDEELIEARRRFLDDPIRKVCLKSMANLSMNYRVPYVLISKGNVVQEMKKRWLNSAAEELYDKYKASLEERNLQLINEFKEQYPGWICGRRNNERKKRHVYDGIYL